MCTRSIAGSRYTGPASRGAEGEARGGALAGHPRAQGREWQNLAMRPQDLSDGVRPEGGTPLR